MAVVLLKEIYKQININEQQLEIIKYSRSKKIFIDIVEIEISNYSLLLEDRIEFKSFLKSLKKSSSIVIYDIWVFSSDIFEIMKIFECLFKRDISLHICKMGALISCKTPSLEVLNILLEYKKQEKLPFYNKKGRPKGRISKSKFDFYRFEIIEMLEKGYTVNYIAKEIDINRSSLRDYINSRGLKDLIVAKNNFNEEKKLFSNSKAINTKCELIEINFQEGK